MAHGRNKNELGVTETMISTFGETVFALSHNVQRRRGDPVRLRDFDEVERQRADMGLSDGQIAQRLGLEAAQVTYIRNAMEWRKFERRNYHRLNALGGGRRYRADRIVRPEDERSMSEAAASLRAALRFRPELARRYVEEGWWQGDTLTRWLDRHAAERPEHPALIQGDETVAYAELRDRVERLAAGLYALGLRKGDVVAVQLPNDINYIVSYLAIARIGGAMTTIYLPYREQEMRTLMGHAKARAFIGLADLGGFAAAATARDLTGELPWLSHVIALGGAVEGCAAYTDLAAASPDSLAGEPPVAADPFLLLYTSGTTALPKGVPHPYHTMLTNARLGVGEHRVTPEDRMLSAAPFGHLFGLYSVHMALYAGATLVLLPVFTPPALAETVSRHKATVLFCAPAHIAACLGAGLFAKFDFTSLRHSIMSGAAVPPSLAEAFAKEIGPDAVAQLWGMTETQAGLYTRPNDPISVTARTAGRASPSTEIRIAGANGEALSAGQEGELQIRGPLLFPGYYENPAATADAFTGEGWFRTGDLAVQDEGGNVAIVGRSKDIINRGGVKFNPRDIEDLLDAHPQIAQSAIVPMPDPVLGERACCFITLKGTETPTLEQLCVYLLGHKIAKTKLPERLEIVDTMPMTATRKIIKGQLKPRAAS